MTRPQPTPLRHLQRDGGARWRRTSTPLPLRVIRSATTAAPRGLICNTTTTNRAPSPFTTATMVADSDSKSLYASSNTAADRNLALDGERTGVSERDGQHVPSHDATGYSILEQPMGTLRPLRVILMGAGASSLNFFKQAEQSLPGVRVTCYEKNADVGGTWYENRYPGCACDIPSVNYQFSWRIRVWTHYYSSSREIWRYLKDIEEENDFIKKYIKLRHQVEHVEWDEEAGVWRVRVRDLATDAVVEDEAEFFINAGGVLNKWRWPAIPGLHDFGGKLMHSANYDDDYDLAGKRVAVIGAGSSGVQIVARIQKSVAHLYHWVRTPIWITAGFGQTWAGKDGANFACKLRRPTAFVVTD